MPQLWGKTSAFDIDLFNNRMRTKTTMGRRDQMIPIEENTWTTPIPKTRHLSSYDADTRSYIPSPRRLSLEAKLQERVLDELPIWERGKFFVVSRTPEIRCYFHHSVYQFVEMNTLGNKVRHSNPYKTKDWAMYKFRRGLIWAGNIS